ncbi:MAG: tetratricopeptide repeat protein [Candidatus Omnitrophota bacterium]
MLLTSFQKIQNIIPAHKRFFIAVAIVFCAVGFLAYSNSLHSGFQFDDYKIIVENPPVHHLENPQWVWRFDPTRFLPHLTFAFNFFIGKLNVFSFHLVNLILHIICSILVFHFVGIFLLQEPRLAVNARRMAFFSGLIFLLHPIQTESVTYIVQRSTVMVALFYMASVVFYLLARLKEKRIYFALSFLCAILGSMTKPNIVTLPLALVIAELCVLRTPFSDLFKRLKFIAPFMVLWVLVPALLLLWKNETIDLAQVLDATKETSQFSRYTYFSTQINVLITYIRLLFLPLRQNFDYDYPLSPGMFSFPTFFSLLILGYLLYFAGKVYKTNKIYSFGILWFFITLIPESSIFPISDVIFEHRLYLPMVGFCILIPVLVMNMCRDLKKATGILLIIAVGLAGLTILRNNVWANQETLLIDTFRKSPHKARVANNLGDYYLRIGNLSFAERDVKKAIELDPKNPQFHHNLGVVYERQGKIDEAMRKYREAIDKDDGRPHPSYYFNLGYLYHNKNDVKKAELSYKAAIAIDEHYADAYCNLGNLYARQGKYMEAIDQFKKSIENNPYHLNAHNGLASTYGMMGQYDEGIKQYEQLLKIKPDFSLAYHNLGKVYVLKKNLPEAEKIFQKALTFNPDDAESYENLANVYYGLDREKDAKAAMESAVRIYEQKGNGNKAQALRNRYLKKENQL